MLSYSVFGGCLCMLMAYKVSRLKLYTRENNSGSQPLSLLYYCEFVLFNFVTSDLIKLVGSNLAKR